MYSKMLNRNVTKTENILGEITGGGLVGGILIYGASYPGCLATLLQLKPQNIEIFSFSTLV